MPSSQRSKPKAMKMPLHVANFRSSTDNLPIAMTYQQLVKLLVHEYLQCYRSPQDILSLTLLANLELQKGRCFRRDCKFRHDEKATVEVSIRSRDAGAHAGVEVQCTIHRGPTAWCKTSGHVAPSLREMLLLGPGAAGHAAGRGSAVLHFAQWGSSILVLAGAA